MFVHTGENLPQDPRYAADLAKLGYKVDEDKQIVSMERAHHFIYFHTSSDRANEKRKEAMHHCARGLVKQELAELGVVEVFLGGEKGREILGVGPKEKPKVKHLPILISEPENLRKKRDVIVVIGEPSENIGIWAWRHLLTSGGIEGGSAVGLVKKLIALGMDSTGVDFKGEGEKRKEMGQKDPASVPSTTSGSESGANTATRRESTTEETTKVPGIIILNPGALLWSNTEKETMTMFTWLARERVHALGEDYAINKTHNYIEGHSSSYEHVETCLDHILPQLLADDAHLYVVGITSSADYFINWYQSRRCTLGTSHYNHPEVSGTPSMIKAMAFMEPTHNASSIKCEAVERVLKERGRQWVKSSRPLGEFLNTVKPMPTPILPSFPTKAKGSDLHLPDYGAACTEATTTTLTSHAGSEKAARADLAGQAGKANLEESVVGDHPVVASHTGTALASPTENSYVIDLKSKTSSTAATGVPGQESTIPNGASAVEAEKVDQHGAITQVPASENALEGLEVGSEELEIDDSMSLSYDHTKEIVNCDTYSGETDVDEMIWPNVIDDVLHFFKDIAAQK